MLQRKKLRFWELSDNDQQHGYWSCLFLQHRLACPGSKTQWSDENAASLTFSYSFSAPLSLHPTSCSLWSALAAGRVHLPLETIPIRVEGISDTYTSPKLWPLRGPRSREIVMAVGTPAITSWFSDTILQLKNKSSRRCVWFQGWESHRENKTWAEGVFSDLESREVLKKGQGMFKGHRYQPERALKVDMAGATWATKYIIHNDSTGL